MHMYVCNITIKCKHPAAVHMMMICSQDLLIHRCDIHSAYDKDCKLSRHSFPFTNSIKFPLILYKKFVKFDLAERRLNLAGNV